METLKTKQIKEQLRESMDALKQLSTNHEKTYSDTDPFEGFWDCLQAHESVTKDPVSTGAWVVAMQNASKAIKMQIEVLQNMDKNIEKNIKEQVFADNIRVDLDAMTPMQLLKFMMHIFVTMHTLRVTPVTSIQNSLLEHSSKRFSEGQLSNFKKIFPEPTTDLLS